ncbi:hypothetical protein MRX96_050450 [Rhipicephalus microplus]
MDHASRELSKNPENDNVPIVRGQCQRCKEHRSTSQSPEDVHAPALEPDSTAHVHKYQDLSPACEVTILQYLARALSPTLFVDGAPECKRTDENVPSRGHK